MEIKLGLTKGFYASILEDDDWTFIIKLSSLFEAACAMSIKSRLNETTLNVIIDHTELANKNCGKLAFLKALGVLTNPQCEFIRKVAEIRNIYAHNVCNVKMSIMDIIQSCGKDREKEIIKHLSLYLDETITIAGQTQTRVKYVSENTKLVIWLTAMQVLACLHLDLKFSEFQLDYRAFKRIKEKRLCQ